jgi:hypothetical protein
MVRVVVATTFATLTVGGLKEQTGGIVTTGVTELHEGVTVPT